MSRRKEHRDKGPAAVPYSFYTESVRAASGLALSVDMSAVILAGGRPKLNVQMDDAMIARGYLLALGRIEAAAGGRDAVIALVELLTWLDVIAERSGSVASLHPVPVLRYVRGRCHHRFAFAIFEESSGAWCWLPWSVIPATDEPRRVRRTLEETYERELAGRPVLETLKPLEKAIRKLASGN